MRRAVYVVDDEEPIRRSLKLMLAVRGYAPTVFDSGSALLNVVDALVPGCLLLDVRMPDMDGVEVQRHLRSRGAELPVVVMTGHGDLGVAIAALQNGAVAFVEKPFSRAAMERALEPAFLKLEQPEAYEARLGAAAGMVAALRPEERAVLAGLAAGRSIESIADELGTGIAAVEVSRAGLFARLEVDGINEALTVAFAAGLGPAGGIRDIT